MQYITWCPAINFAMLIHTDSNPYCSCLKFDWTHVQHTTNQLYCDRYMVYAWSTFVRIPACQLFCVFNRSRSSTVYLCLAFCGWTCPDSRDAAWIHVFDRICIRHYDMYSSDHPLSAFICLRDILAPLSLLHSFRARGSPRLLRWHHRYVIRNDWRSVSTPGSLLHQQRVLPLVHHLQSDYVLVNIGIPQSLSHVDDNSWMLAVEIVCVYVFSSAAVLYGCRRTCIAHSRSELDLSEAPCLAPHHSRCQLAPFLCAACVVPLVRVHLTSAARACCDVGRSFRFSIADLFDF